MFGAKGLGHDEDKNAAGEIMGMDSLLAERNQDYLQIQELEYSSLGAHLSYQQFIQELLTCKQKLMGIIVKLKYNEHR